MTDGRDQALDRLSCSMRSMRMAPGVGMSVADAQLGMLRIAGAPPELLQDGQINVAKSAYSRGELDLEQFEDRLDMLLNPSS